MPIYIERAVNITKDGFDKVKELVEYGEKEKSFFEEQLDEALEKSRKEFIKGLHPQINETGVRILFEKVFGK